MMTLKELKAVQLEPKGRNAYKAESVDSYMDMVEKLVEDLYKTNSELEEKITILADKLEEYIGREESISETLLSAQKVRESIIKDAKAQAADIVSASQREAKDTIDDIRSSVREEQEHYISLQKEVSDFKAKVLSLYKQHLESISEIPNFEPVQKQESDEAQVEEAPATEGTFEVPSVEPPAPIEEEDDSFRISF